MKKLDRDNVLKTTFLLLMYIGSIFAGAISFAAPVVYADNGIGDIVKFKVDDDYEVVPPDVAVITTDTQKDITIWIHNNEPEGGNCIDEIILTFPDDWQGSIDTAASSATNMGAVVKTNQANSDNPNPYSELENDPRSIRIVPDYSQDGTMLCPSGTTKITIKGLTSPTDAGDSEVSIMTSDENHNEPSDSYVRLPIAEHPVIRVSEAEKVKIEYIQKSEFSTDADADYKFTGKAWGAWGRLDKLFIKSDASADIEVYLDNGDGVYDSSTDDWMIGSGSVAAGKNTINLDNYDSDMDIGNTVWNGFVNDGTIATYYIVFTSGSANLENIGHTDSARYLDPSVVGTGFEGTAEGKVITVNDAPQPADGRKIKVQLVKEEGDMILDVKEEDIPIYYMTDLGTFTEDSPEPTDANGQAEINLMPGTKKGIADVKVCYPDPSCEHEYVGINARTAQTCEITKRQRCRS
ncbi:MAG: hypothetical protein GF411_01810 [Candidatus Lokiarchaeota archaeon]|nr:hypothetical protein [Candidatus Woesearchaeota archaeon]MBD3404854.1 hypothetical protein [Candidatus Lokiarchaeota archaeon]